MKYNQFKLHNYLERYRKDSYSPRTFIIKLQDRINENSTPTFTKNEYNAYLAAIFANFGFDILANKRLIVFDFDMSFDGITNDIVENTPGEIKRLYSFFPTENEIFDHKITLKNATNISFKDMLEIDFQTFSTVLKTFDVYEDSFEEFGSYFKSKIQYQDTTLTHNNFLDGVHIVTTKNLLNYARKSHLDKEHDIADFFKLFIGRGFSSVTPVEFNFSMQQIFRANRFGKYDLNLDVNITDISGFTMTITDEDYLKFKKSLPSVEIIYSLIRQMIQLGMSLEEALSTKFYENVTIWEKMN